MYEILFLGIWWLWWFVPVAKDKKIRIARLLVFTILLLLAGVATIGDYKNVWYPSIVICQDCTMRLGPSEKYRVCGKIAAQEVACILDQKESWYKLGSGNNRGWIYHPSVSNLSRSDT